LKAPHREPFDLHGLDVAIIVAFIVYALWSGLRAKAVAGKNLEEYFLAGRSLPGWKAGCSMAATQFAADTPLLVTGLIATAGIFAVWRLWVFGVAFLLLGFMLAASWRRARIITDAELTELRYGSGAAAWLRGVKAIYFGTIFNCTVLAWVLLAATRIAEPFLFWDQWLPGGVFAPFVTLVEWIGSPITVVPDMGDPSTWPDDVWIKSANNVISILIIISVTTFYSTTGGLRSVVNTDVAQFFLMMVATLLFTWIVVNHEAVGGLSAIPEKLREIFPIESGGIAASEILAFTPSVARDATLAVIVVFAIQWIAQMNSDGTGYLAQRSMACRTDKDAKQAAIIFTFAQVVVRSLLWIPLALGLLIVFRPETAVDASAAFRERTYVDGMRDLLPVGVMGLMLTAMLAALASTVDTHLNWGSSYWTNDIYRRFVCRAWLKQEPNPRTLVWVARGANLFILLVGLIIMTRLESIERAWQVALMLGAGMGVVLVLRWIWWRVTAWGEFASIAVSCILAWPLLRGVQNIGDGETEELAVSFFGLFEVAGSQDAAAFQMILMAALAAIAGIGVSLVTREKMENLVEFYKRARPPGFWGPVAEAAGMDPRPDRNRMWVGFAGVAVCSLSMFSMLTGVGSLLVGSPPPTWFPWQTAWGVLVLAVGIGTVPVWWRLAFSRNNEIRDA
jgi:solute:Na+ symporter, SSS family